MKKFVINIQKNTEALRFEVIDYAHHQENQCKFELYTNNKLVASFEPGRCGYLQICKNPGNIDEDTLNLVAEKIESYHFQLFGKPGLNR